MKNAADYDLILTEERCPHSKLVDENFRRVTLRIECEKCRREAFAECAREAWDRAAKVPIHMIIGGRAWTEEQAAAAKILQDVSDNIAAVGERVMRGGE